MVLSGFGGIRHDEYYPGYKHVIIDPQVPHGVTWVKTSKETPYGKIAVDWKTENDLMSMEIKIPVGCRAEVTIPGGNETYTVNGKNCKREKPLIELESGKYIIVYRLTNMQIKL